ncbi:MAG: allophanate hydrolase [Acidiferrobacterales bacterium]
MHFPSLDISSLRRGYLDGRLTPTQLVEFLYPHVAGDDSHHIWIARLDREQLLKYARAIEDRDPATLPLYGIPFAIKDNIDLAGIATTAACPAYAYVPRKSATVVQRLIDAGAIPVGKTNLDQFATGLNGTRSPYGACRNSFDAEYIAGGSSSGSAVATALGLVSFALGTDTAGSGRIPAAFNNLVGLKPTRGLLSNAGVVPACRTLDCVSIFALAASDAQAVLNVVAAFDPADPYSRHARTERGPFAASFRFGVPVRELEFFGNSEYAALFDMAIEQLQMLGGERVEIDFEPFLEAARLLYEGPWLAERYAGIRDFLECQPQALSPVTRAIIEQGRLPLAVDTFEAMYRLAALRRAVEPVLAGVDMIATPTAGTIYRISELDAEPIRFNANLGYYTNFMNLLDLAAVAAPAGFTGAGLPFGITLFADAFSEPGLLAVAARLEAALRLPLGATGQSRQPANITVALPSGFTTVVVCGAHMGGLPLNYQLAERGGYLLERTRTAAHYRFYVLPGGPPARPGLVRVTEGGASIDVEVWALPLAHFGSFVTAIPAPLGIGRVILADGQEVQGFVCEAFMASAAHDITAFGGWRQYLASCR